MRTHQISFVAALAVLAMTTVSAKADSSYQFAISFSEASLAAHGTPDEYMVNHYEGWDSAIARIGKRNKPFIEITNTSTSATPLTQFTMSIAKPQYDFNDDVLLSYAKLGTTTPGINISSSSPDDGDTLLVVDFLDGLDPNETVRFQVDIDVDYDYANAHPEENIYMHPDYRMVFFDVNGNDNSDNSVLTATFSGPGGDSTQTTTLPDFAQDTPVYLGGESLRNYTDMDMVERFELTGEVPEPSTAALTLLSLAAARGLTGRRRR